MSNLGNYWELGQKDMLGNPKPQPVVVRAEVYFEGFMAYCDIPLSEADAHRLRTNPSEHALFCSNRVFPALADAVAKATAERVTEAAPSSSRSD